MDTSMENLNCVTFIIGKFETSFRVFLCAEEEGEKWIPVVLVSSRGASNPLHDSFFVYQKLEEILNKHNLKKEDCTFFLDLTEYLGSKFPNLFRWKLGDKNKPDNLEPIELSQLKGNECKVLCMYYQDRWSLFTDSLLSNDEKTDLIALALTNSVYDEYGADHIQLLIRYKLLNAIRAGKNFAWNEY